MYVPGAHSVLAERFERAARAPRLMTLYPPVSMGRPYEGRPEPARLWEGESGDATLYVHVPFCERRCAFCPFYAVVADGVDLSAYVDDLLEEAALYSSATRRVRFTSVYLGGGTPSILSPDLVARLLGGLSERLRVDGAEVAMEAHPAHVEPERLQGLIEAGVTRLSIGIESFDPGVLEAMDRGRTAPHVVPAVEASLASGLRDVGIDLMYGLPDQTLSSWRSDLAVAADLGVPGLTLYATVYSPPFQRRCESEHRRLAGPQGRIAMYEAAYDFLGEHGYPQPHFGAGAFLRHGLDAHRANVAVGRPTLGLGAWALSSTGAHAWQNATPPDAWSADVRGGRPPIRKLVDIPAAERARKYVIEALLLAYLDLASFHEAFGMHLDEAFPVELEVLHDLGLILVDDGELRLTRKGGHHLREVRYTFASESVVEALEAAPAFGP